VVSKETQPAFEAVRGDLTSPISCACADKADCGILLISVRMSAPLPRR